MELRCFSVGHCSLSLNTMSVFARQRKELLAIFLRLKPWTAAQKMTSTYCHLKRYYVHWGDNCMSLPPVTSLIPVWSSWFLVIFRWIFILATILMNKIKLKPSNISSFHIILNILSFDRIIPFVVLAKL